MLIFQLISVSTNIFYAAMAKTASNSMLTAFEIARFFGVSVLHFAPFKTIYILTELNANDVNLI